MSQRQSSVPAVGIVGAGQLARMTYQAAISLGVRVPVLATSADESAALVAREVQIGSPMSGEDLRAFAARCDVVTFDHELVAAEHLAALEASGHHIRPAADTVRIVQNKRLQRERLAASGFPVPAFRPVATVEQLLAFAEANGWPVVAKACRGGYDGRGVWVLDSPRAAEQLVQRATEVGIELLAEAFVRIERELAMLVARRPAGEAVVYPLVETLQVGGICHELLAPARVDPRLAREAAELVRAIAEAVGVVGILAVELFETDGHLIVNELAARPHNSGHYSIEGCITSQFENHVRAVLDWPLGDSSLVSPYVATVNVLGGKDGGDPLARLPRALAVPGARVHLYAKQARPGRKLGHVTALGRDADEALARARCAARRLAGEEGDEADE